MADQPLYQLDTLALGASNLVYVSRDDGSADGKASLTAVAAIIDGVNGANYAPVSHTHAFADLTGLPTTLAGFGITDAYTKAEVDAAILAGGSGVSDGDKGDLTVSASGATWTIDSGAVTLAKIANAAASSKLLGSGASGAGSAYAELTLGTGLSITGTTLNAATVTDGDKGDVVVSSSGATWLLDMPLTPGGRLTLTTGTPVMTADATAQGTVYYAPYVHARAPIYDGTNWAMKAFSQLTLTLNSTDNTSTNLYDVFVFNNAGTLTLGTGPAWTNSTTRSAAIALQDGIWTNSASITLRANGSSLGSISANRATYLGTIYCTANGQTGMAFRPSAVASGTNNILGLYNAYNRVRVNALMRDASASWNGTSTSWATMHASTANRISWVDGLQQSSLSATFAITAANSSTSTNNYMGVALDSTTATPQVQAMYFYNSAMTASMSGSDNFAPQLGLHYVQWMYKVSASTGVFLGLDGGTYCAYVSAALEM